MIIQMSRFIFMKTLRPRWLSAPAWGYIHVYDYNIYTSSLQPHGRSKPNFVEGERKFVLMVKVT